MVCLDHQSKGSGLTKEQEVEQNGCFSNLWILFKSKDSLVAQRYRSRLLKMGDENTKFFYACMERKKRFNSLVTLKSMVASL